MDDTRDRFPLLPENASGAQVATQRACGLGRSAAPGAGDGCSGASPHSCAPGRGRPARGIRAFVQKGRGSLGHQHRATSPGGRWRPPRPGKRMAGEVRQPRCASSICLGQGPRSGTCTCVDKHGDRLSGRPLWGKSLCSRPSTANAKVCSTSLQNFGGERLSGALAFKATPIRLWALAPTAKRNPGGPSSPRGSIRGRRA